MGKISQKERILELLRQKQFVTTNELRRVGGFRYPARLCNLRDEGHVIEKRNKLKDGWEYTYGGLGEKRVKT